jgi:hypothetical protein
MKTSSELFDHPRIWEISEIARIGSSHARIGQTFVRFVLIQGYQKLECCCDAVRMNYLFTGKNETACVVPHSFLFYKVASQQLIVVNHLAPILVPKWVCQPSER